MLGVGASFCDYDRRCFLRHRPHLLRHPTIRRNPRFHRFRRQNHPNHLRH